MKKLDWCCFVSQSGAEMVSLCEKFNIIPDRVITNNAKKLSVNTYKFLRENRVIIIEIPFNPEWIDYKDILVNNFVTLHGYLRILPREYFSLSCSWNTFNGHPGLITKHPTLKGKNPQEKAYIKGMEVIGSVVHEVTKDVDEGRIVEWDSVTIDPKVASLDDYYNALKRTSFQSWVKFFNKKLVTP